MKNADSNLHLEKEEGKFNSDFKYKGCSRRHMRYSSEVTIKQGKSGKVNSKSNYKH